MTFAKLLVIAAILLPASSALADGPSPAARFLQHNPGITNDGVDRAMTIAKSPQYGKNGQGQATIRVQRDSHVEQMRVSGLGHVVKGSQKVLGFGNASVMTSGGNVHDLHFGDVSVYKTNGEFKRFIVPKGQ